jgi:hypothetical protein
MRIGFTGHRPNRLHIGGARVAARLGEVVARLKADPDRARPGEPLIAISALAEGSDRLFAEAGLDAGLTLHALLPMPVSDYVETFEDSATTQAFHALLARCARVEVLPGTLADSKAAYEALGRAIVAGCDVLVTVWDGKPAAGRGGTPEVIEFALAHGRPVIWIEAAQDRPAQRLQAIAPRIEATEF